jgi:hypothetical protein
LGIKPEATIKAPLQAVQNTCPATWVNTSMVPNQRPFQAFEIPSLVERIEGIYGLIIRKAGLETCPFLSVVPNHYWWSLIPGGGRIALCIVVKTAPVLSILTHSVFVIWVFRGILNSPFGLVHMTL